MDEVSIHRILREHGFTPNYHSYQLVSGGKTTYLYMVADAKNRGSIYLAPLSRVMLMDEETLRQLVVAKSHGDNRNSCGKEPCKRRKQYHNRAVFATPMGNVVVYLCDACFAEYQSICRAKAAAKQ